jgi:hypothetical protein
MAYETPEDQPDTQPKLVEAWLEALECAEKEEKDWIDQAERAVEAYRGDPKSSSRSFNIFHSNTETIVPALYNSTPVPDVRRRYNDDGKAAKAAGDVIERSISYSIDVYDFDNLMLSGVKDMAIVSRGMARVAYEPEFVGEGDDVYVADEQVCCKYVPWRSFRRGPARVWNDVPWIAFEHFLGKESIQKLNPDVAEEKFYLYSAEAKDDKDKDEGGPRFGKRARVWEIWDKDERKVYFISPDYAKGPIVTLDDPLGLQDFFPIPRPMQAVSTPDSLVPVTMLSIYSNLVDELNIVTRRIAALVKQLRPRGGYAGLSADIKALAEAGDGELTPFTNTEMLSATGGDLNKLIMWFPLDPTVKALAHLVPQRDAIKQTIYEVTGIADIMRGASNPNETLGAQQMKAQMGSMRVQRMQAEVQRFARDLFRLKAEVMCNKFGFETLEKITGLRFPTQQEKQAVEGLKAQYEQMAQQAQAQGQPAPPPPVTPEQMGEGKKILESPTREEVEAIIRDHAVRSYNIDIETDSTVRGDVMRNQQQMGGFVQGLGSFFQAVGPAVQAGAMPPNVAGEMVAAFARTMKLGKQVEDAISRWMDGLREQAENPQPKPNPEEMKLQLEAKKAEQDAAIRQKEVEQKGELSKAELAMKAEATKAELEMKAQAQERELALKEGSMAREMELKQAVEGQRIENERAMGREKMDIEHGMMREKMAGEQGMAREKQDFELGQKREVVLKDAMANQEAIQTALSPLLEQQMVVQSSMADGMQQMAEMMMQSSQQTNQVLAALAGEIQQVKQVAGAKRKKTLYKNPDGSKHVVDEMMAE